MLFISLSGIHTRLVGGEGTRWREILKELPCKTRHNTPPYKRGTVIIQARSPISLFPKSSYIPSILWIGERSDTTYIYIYNRQTQTYTVSLVQNWSQQTSSFRPKPPPRPHNIPNLLLFFFLHFRALPSQPPAVHINKVSATFKTKHKPKKLYFSRALRKRLSIKITQTLCAT